MKDPAVWDQLLQRYVDGDGRVDYAGWQSRDAATLRAWLAAQTAHTEGRQEQLAHWINLYNAFTVQAVLEAYPIASIRPSLPGLPNWVGFLRFFQRPLHRLQDGCFSLAQIENQLLRQLGDPRIHFAIVCASVGCPLLRQRAYRTDAVEQQLEADLHRFIHNPAKVRFERERNILWVSRIFQWYRADFLAVSASLPGYILPRLGDGIPPCPEPQVRFLPYDWSLNQQRG
ncbi:DUF547 domain-containing protein [Cyanobium sp. NS01]|uniref:DUF547 domain-containing protein n=1 Tax=Cyanobium sp. NS01 TaxID=261284 RepID=UPI0016442CE2|nr:DUF547 domain-containing protein [Cyanobium sp. NS01]QNI71480.1 hypothetical protein CyaNS01_02363 [Cyanobium sp. NS01]